MGARVHDNRSSVKPGIAGKRAITGDTALRLGHWFRNSAEFWLNLQSAYELRLAEQAAGPEIEALPVMPDSM